jgi:short-subunit dehydrogenase
MSPLQDRFGGAALVTGASAGIGEAFARELAAQGMDLVLVARRKEKLDALAVELAQAHKVRTLVVAQDLAEPEAASQIKAAVAEGGFTVGLLVNNAGFGALGNVEALPLERQLEMVDVNCKAPMALTKAFVDGMVARKKGGIIFVASTSSFQPIPHFATYAASKAFTRYWAEALHHELAPKGVAVLALSPGYTESEFQDVAHTHGSPGGLPPAHPADVVRTALTALGREASVIDGAINRLSMIASTLLPGRFVTLMAGKAMLGTADDKVQVAAAKPAAVAPPKGDESLFVRDVTRMLMTFLVVPLIDITVGSLLTGKLRFWFPTWLDAQWASRPDAWVVYSQSYFAGIFMIPVMARIIDRDLLTKAGNWRWVFWSLMAGVLGFILWWKGGLMQEFHKERETLAWLLLTVITWHVVGLAGWLPQRLARGTPTNMLKGIMVGVGSFFLVMSVIDPLLQIVVQRLTWSSGLLIEMGFFIPAGIALLFLSRRLSRWVPG